MSKPTVLVVDDLPTNIQLAASILQNDYRVLFASSGASALKLLKEKEVDLILMDVMMPEMDGFETTSRIRSDLNLTEIPIIYLTANSDQESLIKGFEAGAADYITKPFIPIELKLRVKTHLELYLTKLKLKQFLEENQLVLHQYKEAVDEGTIVSKTDTEGFITYVNDEFCRISGYSREELLNNAHNIIRHQEMPKAAFDEMWKTLKEKKSWEGIVKNRKKNGDAYIVKALIKPIVNMDGEIVEYMAIRQDITEVYELQDEIAQTQKEIIEKLGELSECRSQETGQHVRRVAEYSALLAQFSDLSSDEIEKIRMASPMHDIGKIGIPDDILMKPGKLSEDEFKIMKTHSKKGYDVFYNSKREVLQAAAVIAHEHHERWDGKGYPQGLMGKDIHIYGRITALADVFDALGSERVYKKAWPLDKIIDFLKSEAGRQFDPDLVTLFLDNIDAFITVRDKFLDKIVEGV